MRGFFREGRTGLELTGQRRPSVTIPDEWQVDWILARLTTAGQCTLRELNDWAYSWEEIWQMHDMLDLSDWLEWRHHMEAENRGNR